MEQNLESGLEPAWPEWLALLLFGFICIIMALGSSLPLWTMIVTNAWPLTRIIGIFWIILRVIDLMLSGPSVRRYNREVRNNAIRESRARVARLEAENNKR